MLVSVLVSFFLTACSSTECARTTHAKQPIRSLRPQQTVVVRIDASKPLNDTRIRLVAGQVYDFSCDNSQRWTDLITRVSPAGDASALYRAYISVFNPLKRCRHAPWFALIGRTTGSDRDCFLIGSQLSGFKVRKTGDLYCYANDVKGFYFNNSGSVSLSITRRK